MKTGFKDIDWQAQFLLTIKEYDQGEVKKETGKSLNHFCRQLDYRDTSHSVLTNLGPDITKICLFKGIVSRKNMGQKSSHCIVHTKVTSR